tara:strand:+ start:800 stop:1003 length:204 start_codon:yes stop_codon:yes gene_type:complete
MSTKKLDLHGVRHSDVDRLVENFVLLNDRPLSIVCGNSDKMPNIIENVLERYDIEWWRVSNGEFRIL